jgi:hypothetical protein
MKSDYWNVGDTQVIEKQAKRLPSGSKYWTSLAEPIKNQMTL